MVLNVLKHLYERNIEDIIPPPINACYRDEKEMINRNKALEMIELLGNDTTARSIWKKYKGYHMRS